MTKGRFSASIGVDMFSTVTLENENNFKLKLERTQSMARHRKSPPRNVAFARRHHVRRSYTEYGRNRSSGLGGDTISVNV